MPVDVKDIEQATVYLGIFGAISTFLSMVWVKFIKPVMSFVKTHDSLISSVETIKKELTRNGGGSLKDAVGELSTTINRIEKRQKIIEQRTKAALHYNAIPLFEINPSGRLTWHNNHFDELIQQLLTSVEGYDWFNLIVEEDRSEFFDELQSCLSMNRNFSRTTELIDGKCCKFVGYPYRINDREHGGYLVSVSCSNCNKGE